MRDLLYKFSWVGVIILFIGFVAVTPIDAINQSKSTGQFWNAIIVAIAFVVTVVAAIILAIFRLLQLRRTLADIPRRYMIHLDDVSAKSAKLIASERTRCADIVERAKPQGKISHAGLMNPEVSNGVLDVPYEDVIIASSSRMELRATQLSPLFQRPIGMPFREYLLLLNSYKLIDNPDLLGKFIDMYEKARFSGKPIEEDQFNEYVACCIGVMFSIKAMDGNQSIRTQDSPSLFPSDSNNMVGNLALSRTSTLDRVLPGSRCHSRESSHVLPSYIYPHSSSSIVRPPITRFNSALSPSHTLSPLSTHISVAHSDGSDESSDIPSDSSVIIRRVS